MRVGMTVGLPTTNPRRTKMLSSLSVLGYKLQELAAEIASEFDIYVQGAPFNDLLHAVGTQLLETVERNTPAPDEGPSLEKVKALTSSGKLVDAVVMYRMLQTQTGGDASLLTAKRYIDKLRGF